MDAGLRVVNSSGVVQIDGNYSNFCLHSKQTVSFNATEKYNRVSVSVPVPYPGQCLIAVHADVPITVSGFTDTSVLVMAPKGNLGVSCTVYFFVPSNLAPVYSSGQGGLRVYRSDGTLAFDSSARLVRIEAYSPKLLSGINTGRTSKYAVAILNEAYSIEWKSADTDSGDQSSWEFIYSSAMVKPTPTGCELIYNSYISLPRKSFYRPPQPYLEVGALSILLLDVRDY